MKAPRVLRRIGMAGLCVVFLALAWRSPSLAAILNISRSGDRVVVSWPKDSANYTLQVSSNLADGWLDVTNMPTVVGAEIVLTNDAAAPGAFYRLTAPGPTAPVLSDLIVSSSSFLFGGTSLVSFAYLDPDCDIVALDVVASNALRVITNTVPAGWLRIDGTSGEVVLPFAANEMPFGVTAFRVSLRDRHDEASAAAEFTLEVSGTMAGGTEPTVTGLAPVIASWNRPQGIFDRARVNFTYSYSDPDGDIERIRLRVTDPNGFEQATELKAAAHGISGNQGLVTVPLIAFASINPFGSYLVELTLIDRRGHQSVPAAATVDLLFDGGLIVPAITTLVPANGVAGTVVTLNGSGFDPEPTNNIVTLSEVPAEVMVAEPSRLVVLIPAEARTGRFVLRHSNTVAASDAEFVVPPSITVTPAAAKVRVGHVQQFAATVISAPSHLVTWSVNDIPGGSADVGTISSTGLYVAPAEIPLGGSVRIAATLLADANVSAQAEVRILPPAAVPGAAFVLASAGGTVYSAEGRASVIIPSNALPDNTTITVHVLQGTNVPPPPSGERNLAAVDFGPEGTVFNAPVTMVLPLAVAQAPGTQLPARIFNPANGTYAETGIFASVASNGVQAIAQLNHFSVMVLSVPEVLPAQAPPVISSVTLVAAQEGTRVPVLIEGTGLNPELEVEVLRNGNSTDDVRILPASFHALDDRAGLILDIQPIPGLNEGQSREYTLRLRQTAAGLFADTNITVHGLDELIVPDGSTRALTLADNGRYSMLHVGEGAMLTNADNHVVIEVTGPVTVDGTITTKGADGSHAALNVRGRGGLSARFGGDGGMGREDNGCFEIPIFGITPDPDPFDCAEPENFGLDSNLPRPNERFPLGIGGGPGVNVNLLEDALDAIADAALCAGTAGLACVELGADVVEIIEEINAIAVGAPVGKQGFPGAPPVNGFGNGGGGGGGGGRFSGVVPFSSIRGGGGGGGGAGGWPLSLISSRDIQLAGVVTSQGGRGGDGSDDGERVPFTDFSTGYSGGGGGGGSGGLLTLTAAEGLHQSPGRQHIFVDGGENGFGGMRVVDASGFTLKRLVFRSNRRARASGGGYRETNPFGAVESAATPVFLPRAADGTVEADHQVTTRSLIRVRFKDDRVPLSELHSFVQVIQGTATNEFRLPSTPAFEFNGYVRLFPGFNTLAVQGMHELLHKHILFLAGTDVDGDGLYVGDEAFFGTDPNDPDTDDDGLNDSEDVLAGADPLKPDTDDDGFLDGQEAAMGLDPANADTDHDGYLDGAELALGGVPGSPGDQLGIGQGMFVMRTRVLSGAHMLAAWNPLFDAFGVLGNPNSGLEFGITYDDTAQLLISQRSALVSSANPAQAGPGGETIATTVGNFLIGGGSSFEALRLAFNMADCRQLAGLYGMELNSTPPGQLLRIAPDNAIASRIGSAVGNEIHALAFHPDGRLFAAIAGQSDSDRLVRLDPQSGAVLSDIGAVGVVITGLTFSNTVLFGSTALPNGQGQLLTLNLATGAATVFRTFDFPIYDLAIAPDPLPGLSRPIEKFWYPNGPVTAIAEGTTAVYLGGLFNYVGPYTGPGVTLNSSDGALRGSSRLIEGNPVSTTANTVAADGAGGWYISGDFTTIDCVPRLRMARLRNDGSVDPNWNPSPNIIASAIAVAESTVYVGGSFSFIGGATRQNLAALDSNTGVATSWNPGANGTVDALLVSGDVLYVGGRFTQIGGEARTRLAALDRTTGAVLPWAPSLLTASFGRVSALAISGNALFAGGLFGVNGAPLSTNLAAFDLTSAAPLFPEMMANSFVRTLAATNGVVYVGGDFTSINQEPRSGLAAIDAGSGQLTAWTPAGAASTVHALAVSASTAYVGGGFSAMGGDLRVNLAAVDLASGAAMPVWITGADRTVLALSLADSNLFVGGLFTSAGGVPRQNVAALDLASGRATDWAPNPDQQVNALAVCSDTVYVGGDFNQIGGVARHQLASVDVMGNVLLWNPDPMRFAQRAIITALGVAGLGSCPAVYVSGWFERFNNVTNGYIAALHPTTGQPLNWNSDTNPIGGPFNHMLVGQAPCAADRVYVTGYSLLRGVPNNGLAALSAGTGDPTSWSPALGIAPTAIAQTCLGSSSVFAAGTFPTLGNVPMIADIRPDGSYSAIPTMAMNGGSDSEVQALAVGQAGILYIGGSFDTVGGAARQNVAALARFSGELQPWAPNISGAANTIVTSPTAVYVGGNWTIVRNTPRRNFAVFKPLPRPFP